MANNAHEKSELHTMDIYYIFFKGILDTIDFYTDEFVTVFKSHGKKCLILHTGHMSQEILRLKAILQEHPACTVSFNNIGLHIEMENGTNIWDYFHVPFYNIMMDHPFHYKTALETAPKQMVLLCMDKNHINYVKRFFPDIQTVLFFPHAGIMREKDHNFNKIPITERKIDVLYAGGLSRYAAEGLIPDLGQITEFDAFELTKCVLQQLISNPSNTTEDAIESYLKSINLPLNDSKLGEIITNMRFIDTLAVSFFREQMIRVLTENGITVTVFGNGWDRIEWNNPNFIYGGEIMPQQVLELMEQSKIVLNTMTWFKRGAHDRIFNGMLAGAAIISDISSYMEKHFTSGTELYLFSLKDMKNLLWIVQELLGHPKTAQQIAECGYEAAIRNHRWEHRLCSIHLLDKE